MHDYIKVHNDTKMLQSICNLFFTQTISKSTIITIIDDVIINDCISAAHDPQRASFPTWPRLDFFVALVLLHICVLSLHLLLLLCFHHLADLRPRRIWMILPPKSTIITIIDDVIINDCISAAHDPQRASFPTWPRLDFFVALVLLHICVLSLHLLLLLCFHHLADLRPRRMWMILPLPHPVAEPVPLLIIKLIIHVIIALNCHGLTGCKPVEV